MKLGGSELGKFQKFDAGFYHMKMIDILEIKAKFIKSQKQNSTYLKKGKTKAEI